MGYIGRSGGTGIAGIFRTSVPGCFRESRPMEFAFWIYPLLFATGLAAGLVDSIAGGGGLISLPMLLTLGLPVPAALGTNKFQSMCGTFSASRHYVSQGLIDFRACRVGLIATFVGALIGVLTVQRIDSQVLARLIPWLLALIFMYTVFRPKVGEQDHPPRMRNTTFYVVFGLTMGFYDGFFGPGAGLFWTISLIVVQGQNFAKATGYTKVMNLVSNIVSVAIFAYAGLIHYGAGIATGVGQVIGARLGSGLVLKKGAGFIRPIFLIVVGLMLLRLLWVNYHR